MHRPPKVRFLIANASQARWVERGEHGFVALGEIHADGHQHAVHHKATVHQSAGSVRHGAGEVNVSERRREDFGADLAEMVNQAAAKGEFERLAIVAPPRLLGEIRDRLTKVAQSKVVREIGKDLTKTADHDLAEWLQHPDLA